MSEKQDFSPAEFEVMKVFWQKGSASPREIHDELSKTKSWRYTTVQTFIARLYKKGHIRRRKKDGAYLYTPVLSRKKTIERIVRNFLNRVFDGDITPLVNYLSESKNLKPEEVAALKELIAVIDKDK